MTTQEMYAYAKSTGKNRVVKFMDDMWDNNLQMRYYQGRNFWQGPAVETDDLQEVLSCTKVTCSWDNLGHGYIVYPHESF